VQKDLLAFIGCDETKAFFFIEEFHFAGWHDYLFLRVFHFTKGDHIKTTARIMPCLQGYPRRMTKSKPSGPSRLETVLAYMGAGIIGLSLLSIVITLVRSFFGETTNLALFAQIPLIALPIGFVLVLFLLFLSVRRKRRENKQ
jgi:hypothetical protein